MKKIVELVIKLDDIEFNNLGGDALSLVENPAIELDFLAFQKEDDYYVDETGFEGFREWIYANQELFKKPGGGAAGDGGVNHGAQIKLLEEAGIETGFPFGYCFQVAQFLFYAAGGYESDFDLKCIKKMEYQVNGVDFQSTHWYIQNRETGQIVDLTAEQFDGILDLNQYYSEGRRANLGFPYYNVGNKKVEFEETVPSIQTLKLYDKYREDVEKLEGIEKYYKAAKYEELRKEFEMQFNAEDLFLSAFAVDVSQLPQYVDELDDEQKWILSQCEQMGEEYDLQKSIFIDANRASFSTLRDFLEGITALDILGRRDVTNEGVEVYRYAGPSAERGFCRAMLRLNKVYREEELSRLNRANPGFGENGSNNYNVFEYKGGPNCRHYFERLQMFKDGRETIFVSQGPADGDAGQTNNNNAPSSAGAVENNARLNFSIEEDQRVVVGPAMVPNKMIKRIDENDMPYYVYFTKQTVNDIAEKFLATNKQNMTNVEHNKETITNTNTLLESWIVEDAEMDKAKLYGFDVPEGTWMVKYRINDDEIWQKIKAGKLRGFSIEGYFISRALAMESADNVVEDIIDILSKVQD